MVHESYAEQRGEIANLRRVNCQSLENRASALSYQISRHNDEYIEIWQAVQVSFTGLMDFIFSSGLEFGSQNRMPCFQLVRELG